MKKVFSIIITFIFLTACIKIEAFAKQQVPQNNSDIVNVNFKSALLMEESTGKIIYEHNSHEKLAPASVTKIMTMLLAMEDIDSGKVKLSDKITATARAKSIGGTTMYLETGEVRTVEEILKGISIQSANDGAVAMAEFLGGTEESFIKRMNDRAKQLGMKDTNFINPMGFYDANHYTSAYDIAIMSRELLKHKKILEYSRIWQETISEGRKTPFTLTNTNKMLKGYNGCDGLKTGYVSEAKYCISATALRGSVRFIAVIMGAPTSKERSASASKLLNYGFAKYESKKIENKGNVVGVIKLPKSNPTVSNVVVKDDLSIVTEKGAKVNLEKQLELNKDLKLPIKKGDIVGSLKVIEGSKVYGTVPVICDNDIKKMKISDLIKKSFNTWLNLK